MKTTSKIIDNNLYEYDEKGNEIHFKYSDGYEVWREYDENNNIIHRKYGDGDELWYEYDENNKLIHQSKSIINT